MTNIKEYFEYVLGIIGALIIFYWFSKIQMRAWLNAIEQFLNKNHKEFKQKSKENEQKKKK